jgi:hypothetical protein
VKFRWDVGSNAFVPISDNWAYTTQNACSASGPGGPPDRIGVYLQLKHYGLTTFVFTSAVISDSAMLTLEPIPLLDGCS